MKEIGGEREISNNNDNLCLNLFLIKEVINITKSDKDSIRGVAGRIERKLLICGSTFLV